MNVKVTSLSSKGQIVIPRAIRKKLGLASGANLLVLTDGSNVLLKPMRVPKLKTFERLVRESRKLAGNKKLTKRAVSTIITNVRNEGRS